MLESHARAVFALSRYVIGVLEPMATRPNAAGSSENDRRYGPLIVVSGPSGTGKSTLIGWLIRNSLHPLRLSVSATTRQPRPGESDGVEYHFWTRGRFDAEVAREAFLEWAEVFGNCYGTLRAEVDPYRSRGMGVLLDIDVRGADQVRRKCPDLVSIFVRAGSVEEYERRLRMRGTESEAAIQRRLAGAARELAAADRYDHAVVNDDLRQAEQAFQEIVDRQFTGG